MIKKISLKTIFLSLILAIGAISGSLYWRQNRKYQVKRVIDGDTIELSDGRRIRYINIDSPELSKGKNKDECFSRKAKQINKELVEGKTVSIETDKNKMDRFGRTLAYVYRDHIFINQQLLEQGAGKFYLDTVNRKYQPILITAANQAHQKKIGLWRSCALDPNKGCQIKGNLDRLGQRWYHLPEFRHYSQVIVNLKKGDQWFCTEAEVIKAGFKKARK